MARASTKLQKHHLQGGAGIGYGFENNEINWRSVHWTIRTDAPPHTTSMILSTDIKLASSASYSIQTLLASPSRINTVLPLCPLRVYHLTSFAHSVWCDYRNRKQSGSFEQQKIDDSDWTLSNQWRGWSSRIYIWFSEMFQKTSDSQQVAASKANKAVGTIETKAQNSRLNKRKLLLAY